MTLAGSKTPTRTLALSLLRLLADAGVSRDPDTWALLGEAGFKQVFGEAAYRAFDSQREQVWPVMVELAGMVETWP